MTTVEWTADLEPTAEQVYAAIADAHHTLEGKSITGPPLSLVNLYQSMAQKDQNPKSLFQQVSKVVPSKYSIRPQFDRSSALFARWAVQWRAHRIPYQGEFEIAGASDSLRLSHPTSCSFTRSLGADVGQVSATSRNGLSAAVSLAK